MLSEASLQEKGFNFNFKEANEVVLPSPANTLTIRGDVGGLEGCSYPDVYAVDVPDNNRLIVEQLDADGSACTGAGAASISLEIRNGSDALLASSGDPVNGCVSVNHAFTRGGVIYVKLNDEREIDLDRPFIYQLRFTVRP